MVPFEPVRHGPLGISAEATLTYHALTADVPFTSWWWTVGKPKVTQFPITVVKRRSRPLMAFGATINFGNGRERHIPFSYREHRQSTTRAFCV